MDQMNEEGGVDGKPSSAPKKVFDSASPASSRKSQVKLWRKNSKVSNSTRLAGSTRYEVEIDEWHTREAVENPVAKPKVGENTKSTSNSFYLPTLNTDFNAVLNPEIQLLELEGLERTEAVRQLGEVLGLNDYSTNFISFWILETLVTALKDSQKFHMTQGNQKMTIIWIIYVLKTIMIYGWRRRAMFEHLNKLFMKANMIIKDNVTIPSPHLLLVEEKEISSDVTERSSEFKNSSPNLPNSELRKDGKDERADSKISKASKTGYRKSGASHRSLRFRKLKSASSMSLAKKAPDCEAEFHFLVEQIYGIFGSRFKYEVIYTIFSQPVHIETDPICESILKMKDTRSPEINPSGSKKSISRNTKSRHTSSDKRKPDRIKSQKGEIMQKVIKMLLEPVQGNEEQVKTESVSLPYLQPLKDAVDDNFFHQHLNNFSKKQQKKTLTNKSKQKTA